VETFEVLGKRSEEDDLVVVGGVTAPDPAMALLLARETHFRHKEGVAYAVRRRRDGEIFHGPADGPPLGGAIDRAYRRQDGYVGVGAKLKRVRDEMRRRGMALDHPRPAGHRGRDGAHA
jgi:hypothetical protein